MSGMEFLLPALVAGLKTAQQIGEINQRSREAEAQAKEAERQAVLTEQRTGHAVAGQRRNLRAQVAQQRAKLGSAGVAVSGTPLMAFEDTLRAGNREIDAAQYFGAQEAAQQNRSANLLSQRSRYLRSNGALGMATSLP